MAVPYPTLEHCYRLRVSMDKGRDHVDSRNHRHKSTLQISPKWRQIAGWLGLRRITLLRYLFNCWYRRVLVWYEQMLFLELLEDFGQREDWAYFLLQTLRYAPMRGTTYLKWCAQLWTGKLRPGLLEIEDCRWLLEKGARRLLWNQRASKGLVLNRWFLRRLGFLLSEHRSEVLGVKVRRGRKRGHTDHGSLPCNSAAREADAEGGRMEHAHRLTTRLISWLKAMLPP